ncbi:MAG: YbhB/YbcL family Raf kinase inhibitor-like protein [Acidimicrobiales bacterium]
MQRWLVSTILVAGLAVVSGCADDGRDLAEPTDLQTTTTRPPPPTSALPEEAGAEGLTISSPDFIAGGQVPVDATCAGRNVFPALSWGPVPETATELAVSLSDQTDPESPLLLWLMAGINPNVTGFAAGEIPAGAYETLNDYGSPGFGSPCLDALTEGPHDLQFRIYVLDQPSGLSPDSAGNEAWEQVRGSAAQWASVLMRNNIPGSS